MFKTWSRFRPRRNNGLFSKSLLLSLFRALSGRHVIQSSLRDFVHVCFPPLPATEVAGYFQKPDAGYFQKPDAGYSQNLGGGSFSKLAAGYFQNLKGNIFQTLKAGHFPKPGAVFRPRRSGEPFQSARTHVVRLHPTLLHGFLIQRVFVGKDGASVLRRRLALASCSYSCLGRTPEIRLGFAPWNTRSQSLKIIKKRAASGNYLRAKALQRLRQNPRGQRQASSSPDSKAEA